MRYPFFAAILALGVFHGRLVANEPGAGEFSRPQEIEKRLETARAELRDLPGEAAPEISDKLRQLEATCQYHLETVDLLAAARSELEEARQESSAWPGFQEPPPYSVLLLDEIRESIATLGNSERTGAAQIRIFKAEIEALRAKLSGHQQAERRLKERIEKTTDPEALQAVRQALKLENLSAGIIAERIGRRQLRIATEEASLAKLAAKKELANRKLKAIQGNTAFSRGDLDGILETIAREHEVVSRILVDDSKTHEAPNPLLSWKLELLDLEKSFWDARFASINSDDRAEIRAALDTLRSLKGRVDDWVEISELRLAGWDAETKEADPQMLRDAVLRVRAMQRRIGFAIADLGGSGLLANGTSVFGKIGNALQSIWNAELYLVEESDIVDGKKIPVYRAVTVGKIVRLACILLVGWFLLRFLSRKVKALVARRESVPQATADLAGKWAFGIGLILLMLYGLNRVSIPLTVFAFLGGALAIGIGFGTQTLLKNFISGIILLFERPLKIGDVIEVAGITGTIRLIGIRASVIRHFDGIETLVPNSILLENQLTNWTFSSTVIRHDILVGVAYGSPTREVSRLLLAVAAEHGLVKDDPAPEVRFEEFADNALTFRLLFWLDTGKTARSTLASDLRFMIDKMFAEAGISIAFPQRDVHLETITPLQVQMVPATTEKPS